MGRSSRPSHSLHVRPRRHGWLTAGALLVAASLIAACSTPPPAREMTLEPAARSGPAHAAPKQAGKPYRVGGRVYVPRRDPTYDVVGIASWYGKRYHGRRTASGQIFDMHALTAAHPTLPFQTRVKVTNLQNGRSVVLAVTDRGPFVPGRVIDVSRRAAELLGFVRQGTARVRVRVAAARR